MNQIKSIHNVTKVSAVQAQLQILITVTTRMCEPCVSWPDAVAEWRTNVQIEYDNEQ